MAITQTIATLPAVLNDSATFYEDIAERNNSLVTTVLPSINAWATQANTTQSEINAKALQVAAQAVDGGYSQDYINSNFIGVNNTQDITEVKTFTVSPIVPTPITGDRSTKVATTAMFGDEFINSLSGNGYQKLPSGLIIQWGQVEISSGAETAVTLPISYPSHGVLQIFATRNVSGIANAAIDVHAFALSKSQIKLGYFNTGGGSADIMWMTIGY